MHLIVATLFMGAMFFCAKAVKYAADGVEESILFTQYLPYAILIGVTVFLNLVALSAFKFRVFQLRTAVLSAIVTAALQIWLIVDFCFTHDAVVFRLAALFPFAALVFELLACRGILADQLLVESAYSLRKSRRERRRK